MPQDCKLAKLQIAGGQLTTLTGRQIQQLQKVLRKQALEKKDYDLLNVAEGGGGNEMNIRNLSRAIYDMEDYQPVYAILQISGMNRYELITDELIDFPTDAVIKTDNHTWLKSTGNIEWANNIDPRISKPITNYMKYCYNETHQILKTLYSIRNFQTLCYHENVRHKIFFWQKELNEERMKRIFQNKELTYWYSTIDWDNCWFHNQNEKLDTIFQYRCVSNLGYSKITFYLYFKGLTFVLTKSP